MIKGLLYIILVLFIQGCSETDNNSTVLEGTWSGTCIIDGFSTPESSYNTVVTFSNSNISHIFNNYSDTGCTDPVSSSPLEDVVINPESIAIRFEIGNNLVTSNGVEVKEFNSYDIHNNLYQDIFLLQDNNTKLFFGKRCYPSTTGLGLDCIDTRPHEIDYDNYLVKSQ